MKNKKFKIISIVFICLFVAVPVYVLFFTAMPTGHKALIGLCSLAIVVMMALNIKIINRQNKDK